MWGNVQATNVQVEWEDQKNINTFNKLNNRSHELEVEVRSLVVRECDFQRAEFCILSTRTGYSRLTKMQTMGFTALRVARRQ